MSVNFIVTEDKIEEGYGLVYYIIKNFDGMVDASFDWEDLFQLGCIGLIDAVRTFDSSKGMKFSSYACARIRFIVLDRLKSMRCKKRMVKGFSVTRFCDYDNGEYSEMASSLRAPEAKDYSLPEELDFLVLYPRVKKVMTLRLQGETFLSIAKGFGFTECRAYQLYTRGLEIIRERINGVA